MIKAFSLIVMALMASSINSDLLGGNGGLLGGLLGGNSGSNGGLLGGLLGGSSSSNGMTGSASKPLCPVNNSSSASSGNSLLGGLLDPLLGQNGAVSGLLNGLLGPSGLVGGLLKSLNLSDLLNTLGLDQVLGGPLGQLLGNLKLNIGLSLGPTCNKLIDLNTGLTVDFNKLNALLVTCINTPAIANTAVCANVATNLRNLNTAGDVSVQSDLDNLNQDFPIGLDIANGDISVN